MPHDTPLITTIVAALTLAWVFAAVAHRLKLPPLVGYLLAGIVIGPFTPGFVADREQVLETVHAHCPACGGRLRYRYDNRHTVSTLAGLVRPRLRIRHCEGPGCARYRRPYRPEAEGALVLPQHEFGLDVIALVGAWRYREHKSVPEIHRGLRERGVAIAERTVTHLLDRGACPPAG